MRYREIDWSEMRTGMEVTVCYAPHSGCGGTVDFVNEHAVWMTSGTAQIKRCLYRRNYPIVEVEEPLNADECLDYHQGGCCGPVDYRWTGGNSHWPRCEHHWELRMERRENSMEIYADSDVVPDWFDPANAGERWDDD